MRLKPLLLCITALVVALVVCLLCLQVNSRFRNRLLRERLGQIQIALERYAVDTEGAYPPSLDLLISRGYLRSWPLNPYNGKPFAVLAVTEPPDPGGIVYVACGPIIALGRESTKDAEILPTEADQYLLAAYGPITSKQRGSFASRVRDWQLRLGGAGSSQYLAVIAGHPVHIPVGQLTAGEQLNYRDLVPAWDLFAVRLTAGEDANAR